MKISICIPQYNRINYLLKSLSIIERQIYDDIEIVISDDSSTDDTESKVKELVPVYRFPIVYHRNPVNEGYDRNYRRCIEMASGDYALVIGNDDSINGENGIQQLVNFLIESSFPDIGFCNTIEESNNNVLVERAVHTQVLGSGAEVAMKYYSCFSFVGGLIYKTSTFHKRNTAKFDGSVYAQMYLGVYMISSGCTLFSITEPLVIKDIQLEKTTVNSYRDTLARKWKDFKVVDGGLPSVINVLINALIDTNTFTQKRANAIFKRMYAITYPHWILDYRENKALPEAVGLIVGMQPGRNKNFRRLTVLDRLTTYTVYGFTSLLALATPVFVFRNTRSFLYRFVKK